MSNEESEKRSAKAGYRWAAATLGVLLSTSSAISLIQNGLNFDLHWGFSHFVTFYRGIIDPIMDVMLWPIQAISDAFGWEWVIPQWLKDVWTLSFVGASIQVRSHSDQQGLRGGRLVTTFTPTLFVVIFGALGLGLFTFLFIFNANWSVKAKDTPEDQALSQKIGIRARQLFGLTALAVVVFYIANAVAPQLGQ